MPAAYDTYDYPSYWEEREYEHKAEYAAIKSLLNKIPYINTVLEIGGGYGRLVPAYSFRAKRVILSDPSASLLAIARKNLRKDQKMEYLQSTLKNLPNNIRKNSIDLIVMVRVLHHIENTQEAFRIISGFIKDNGYFILEFANKSHLKATLTQFFKGNFTFPLDIFPKDIRSKKSIEAKTLPFINFHPDKITEELKNVNLFQIEKLSVSNIRSTFLKRILGTETLVSIEKSLQKPLSFVNFGPSIFLLCQKRG